MRELTKKELTALCRKQEKHIEELENELNKQTEENKQNKLNYEESEKAHHIAKEQIRKYERLIPALEKSLSWLSEKCDDLDEKTDYLYNQVLFFTKENSELRKKLDSFVPVDEIKYEARDDK